MVKPTSQSHLGLGRRASWSRAFTSHGHPWSKHIDQADTACRPKYAHANLKGGCKL